MSEAAHNGSLVLLCGTEIKWGGGKWRKGSALRPCHKSRMINTRRVDVRRRKRKVRKGEGGG